MNKMKEVIPEIRNLRLKFRGREQKIAIKKMWRKVRGKKIGKKIKVYMYMLNVNEPTNQDKDERTDFRLKVMRKEQKLIIECF